MRYFIYPYNEKSESVKLLKHELGAKVIKLQNSRYRRRIDDVIINWGNSSPFNPSINCNSATATNKLKTFKILKQEGVSIPEFGETTGWAIQKLAQGKTVFARTRLNGHSGQGIVEFKDGDDVPAAPLYVEYVPKKKEYRVHVFDDNIIHIQEKRLKNGQAAHKIRSHDNGYVFATQDVDPPQMVLDESVKAVKALGLLFGAADVIWNEKQRKAFVLEINSAPGLCSTTARKYSDAFKAKYGV
jgi:glutathione synthase/RimK-type ligase-like ATP-grasp enzyme